MLAVKDLVIGAVKREGSCVAVAKKYGFHESHISRLHRGVTAPEAAQKYFEMLADAYPVLREVLSADPSTVESVAIKYVGHKYDFKEPVRIGPDDPVLPLGTKKPLSERPT